MDAPVVIGCSRCKRLVSLREEDLQKFNKQNQFVCDECLNPKPVEETHEEPQFTQNLDVDYVQTEPSQSPIQEPQPIPIEYHQATRVSRSTIPLDDGRKITGVTESANDYIAEINRTRERIEREIEQERQRVNNYSHSSGPFNLGFVMAFIGAAVALVIGLMIFSAVSSEIDCKSIGINATNNVPSELTEKCENAENTGWTVISILPIALFFTLLVIFGGWRARDY